MEVLKPSAFFKLTDDTVSGLFDGRDMVWEALACIEGYTIRKIQPNVSRIRGLGGMIPTTQVIWKDRIITGDFELKSGDTTKGRFKVFSRGELLEGAAVIYAGASLMDDRIEIGPGVVVEPGALIKGPTIIGANTEVRQGAYVRGKCLVGAACVVGHATEMKNAVMMDGAKAGHFAYLGDSILGKGVNLGAGTKLANLKIMPWPFRIRVAGQVFEVDLKKFGAILGDGAEIGCNAVTSPGTIMGPGGMVAPNMTVPSGYHPPKSFIRPNIKKPRTLPGAGN